MRKLILLLITILLVATLFIGCEPSKPPPVVIVDPGPAVLARIKVALNGEFLESNQEVAISDGDVFEVKGFDVTGTKEIQILGDNAKWFSSCATAVWNSESGLANSISLVEPSDVWVKHGSLVFKFKVKK